MITIRAFNKSCEIGEDPFCPTVFVSGCNFFCEYCMNAKLVRNETEQSVPVQAVEDFVKRGNCKLVVISGGEPLMQPFEDLNEFIDRFNDLGCGVGICTNGYWVKKLEAIIPRLNYVAMDLKTDSYRYKKVTNCQDAYERVLDSADRLISAKNSTRSVGGKFDYEIRTTLYRPLVDASGIVRMSAAVYRQEKWVWQKFRPVDKMLGYEKAKDVQPYSVEEINHLMDLVKGDGHHIILRDI